MFSGYHNATTGGRLSADASVFLYSKRLHFSAPITISSPWEGAPKHRGIWRSQRPVFDHTPGTLVHVYPLSNGPVEPNPGLSRTVHIRANMLSTTYNSDSTGIRQLHTSYTLHITGLQAINVSTAACLRKNGNQRGHSVRCYCLPKGNVSALLAYQTRLLFC